MAIDPPDAPTAGLERLKSAEAALREAINQRTTIAAAGLSAELSKIADTGIDLAIERLVSAAMLAALTSGMRAGDANA